MLTSVLTPLMISNPRTALPVPNTVRKLSSCPSAMWLMTSRGGICFTTSSPDRRVPINKRGAKKLRMLVMRSDRRRLNNVLIGEAKILARLRLGCGWVAASRARQAYFLR